jgi:DNA-binding transcriptional MerR regulator
VPPGDITNAVLAEQITRLRQDQHDDLDDIKRQLDKLVSREVYEAHRAAAAADLATLRRRVEVLEGRGRWLMAVVVMPIIAIAIQFYLSSHGR